MDEKDPCIEMRVGMPWTYQVDLYGVAGIAHAMLFGKYMDVEKKYLSWQIKSKLPRYFNKSLWDNFFNTLLNVRSCKEMPNLQSLRLQFIEEIMDHERVYKDKIQEFNHALAQ